MLVPRTPLDVSGLRIELERAPDVHVFERDGPHAPVGTADGGNEPDDDPSFGGTVFVDER